MERRDFLKVAGVAAAALFVPDKAVRAMSRPETKTEASNVEKIETENAIYYPFYESHDKSPDLAFAMENWDVKPVAHFYEVITGSASDFQKISPIQLLLMESGTPSSMGINREFGPIISDSTLVFDILNRISVSFEGANLPDKFLNFSYDSQFFEQVGTVFAAFGINAYLVGNIVEGKKEENTPAVYAGSAASALALIWSFGPKAAETAQSWNAYKNLMNLHPEFTVIFFRNILMARRLQTLGKYYSALSPNKDEKPGISFSAGLGHKGIADILKMGDKATLSGLNIYPTPVLREIVDANGGIDAFSSVMVIPVKEVMFDHKEATKTVLDRELKAYLEARFK